MADLQGEATRPKQNSCFRSFLEHITKNSPAKREKPSAEEILWNRICSARAWSASSFEKRDCLAVTSCGAHLKSCKRACTPVSGGGLKDNYAERMVHQFSRRG